MAGVQQQACALLNNVCYGTDAAGLAREQRAVEAGALEVVVAAMRAHPQVAAVQEEGSRALGSVCDGNDGLDTAGLARSQRAVEVGALEVLVGALWAHSQAGIEPNAEPESDPEPEPEPESLGLSLYEPEPATPTPTNPTPDHVTPP